MAPPPSPTIGTQPGVSRRVQAMSIIRITRVSLLRMMVISSTMTLTGMMQCHGQHVPLQHGRDLRTIRS